MNEKKPVIDCIDDDPRSVAGFKAAIESNIAQPVTSFYDIGWDILGEDDPRTIAVLAEMQKVGFDMIQTQDYIIKT